MNREPDPEAAALPRGSSAPKDAATLDGTASGPEATSTLDVPVPNGSVPGPTTPRGTSTDHDRSAPQDPFAPQDPAARQESSVGYGSGREDVPSDVVPRTGFGPVDAVLAREAGITRMPVAHRAAAFAELHTELERILAQDPGALPAGLIPSGAQLSDSQLSDSQLPGSQSLTSQSPEPPASVATVPDKAAGQNRPARREPR